MRSALALLILVAGCARAAAPAPAEEPPPPPPPIENIDDCDERWAAGGRLDIGYGQVQELRAVRNPSFDDDMGACATAFGDDWHTAEGSFTVGFRERVLAGDDPALVELLARCPVEWRLGAKTCAPCKPPGPCKCAQYEMSSWLFCTR